MPRSAAPCPEAPQLSTSFSILDNAAFQAPPLRTPRTPRDCVPSCTPPASTARSGTLPPFAQIRSGLGILRTRFPDPAPFAQTRRPGPASTAHPGIWANAHPLTLDCVKPPTTVKTATFRGRRLRRQSSATFAHLGRMTRGCSRTLTRYFAVHTYRHRCRPRSHNSPTASIPRSPTGTARTIGKVSRKQRDAAHMAAVDHGTFSGSRHCAFPRSC